MVLLGTNIARGGWVEVSRLVDLGIGVVRILAYKENFDRNYLEKIRQENIEVAMLTARESFDGFGRMRADGQPRKETLINALEEYKTRYGDVVNQWQLGNEPDHVSVSSWTQSHTDFNRLLRVGRQVLGDYSYIISGGMVDGQPDWMWGVDWSAVNAFAVHPYGRRPAYEYWPDSPREKLRILHAIEKGSMRRTLPARWYFGELVDFLQQYRDKAHEVGYGHLGMDITEWGAPISDFGNDLGMHGWYTGAIAKTLRDNVHHIGVGLATQFCFSAHMVTEFGLMDENWEPRPAYTEYQKVLHNLV